MWARSKSPKKSSISVAHDQLCRSLVPSGFARNLGVLDAPCCIRCLEGTDRMTLDQRLLLAPFRIHLIFLPHPWRPDNFDQKRARPPQSPLSKYWGGPIGPTDPRAAAKLLRHDYHCQRTHPVFLTDHPIRRNFSAHHAISCHDIGDQHNCFLFGLVMAQLNDTSRYTKKY